MSDKKLAIKYFPADKLTTFPGNPRKVKDPDAIKKLTKLIEAHGFQNPLQIWQHEGVNYILCGNHRFKAACSLGYTEFPCIVYTGTKEEALARVISDNKSSDWTEFEYPLLKDMITEIDLGHLDIEITGFGEEELEALFGYEGLTEEEQAKKDAMEDDVPDAPAEPVTRLGDLYLLGRHRLLCGDSTNITDVERLMDGKKADMVFTDPPYGVNYDGGHAVKGTRRGKLKNDETPDIYSDVLPIIPIITKDNAGLYLWFSDSKSAAVTAAVTAAGYEIRNTLIWNKNLAQFGAIGAQYKSKHEPCLYCFKKGKAPFWRGPTNEVSVWDINRSIKNEFHPTQKPVELAERAITNSSPNSGLILDLFLGSGSTLIACEKTGRTCYGMELDPQYCDVIVARWEKFTGKKANLCHS